MATSGSYDKESTMANIVNDAFGLIGAHDQGETLPAEKWAHSKRTLNQLMSLLSIHEGMWRNTEKVITLVPGTESYTIGDGETIDTPRPMRIVDARKTLSGTDIELELISRSDYITIPNKSLQASPLNVYYDQGRTTGTLYFWPTGTSTDKTVTITTSRPIQDFDDEGNNPDLPEEWVMLIVFMLAEKLALTYLGGRVPEAISSQRAEMLAVLLRFDEERGSIFMQP